MSKISRNIAVFTPLIILFALILLALPRDRKVAYGYKKGSPWKHDDLIAAISFPILKTEDQIAEERSRNTPAAIPYYKRSSRIEDRSLVEAEGLDLGGYDFLKPDILSRSHQQDPSFTYKIQEIIH